MKVAEAQIFMGKRVNFSVFEGVLDMGTGKEKKHGIGRICLPLVGGDSRLQKG